MRSIQEKKGVEAAASVQTSSATEAARLKQREVVSDEVGKLRDAIQGVRDDSRTRTHHTHLLAPSPLITTPTIVTAHITHTHTHTHTPHTRAHVHVTTRMHPTYTQTKCM
jgi:hypothetical protein